MYDSTTQPYIGQYKIARHAVLLSVFLSQTCHVLFPTMGLTSRSTTAKWDHAITGSRTKFHCISMLVNTPALHALPLWHFRVHRSRDALRRFRVRHVQRFVSVLHIPYTFAFEAGHWTLYIQSLTFTYAYTPLRQFQCVEPCAPRTTTLQVQLRMTMTKQIVYP